MRFLNARTTTTSSVGAVSVARWDQFGLGDALPFEAMWYSVPPDSMSPPDCHPETELSIVVSGCAYVEVDGAVTAVEQGSAFLLEPDETHVVHNRSHDDTVVIFSAYWMPADVPVLASAGAVESV